MIGDIKTETLAEVLAEMELGNTGDFPFAYRVGMPDEPEVIDVTGAIIKPRAIRIKNVTVKELVDRIKAARERERGNAAAMREALEAARSFVVNLEIEPFSHLDEVASDLRARIDAALAKPPRNCDVGTAEEQAERFILFCRRNSFRGVCNDSCKFANVNRRLGWQEIGQARCFPFWAQMPYTESEAKPAPRPATEQDIDDGKAQWCAACATDCPDKGKDLLCICGRFTESEAGK